MPAALHAPPCHALPSYRMGKGRQRYRAPALPSGKVPNLFFRSLSTEVLRRHERYVALPPVDSVALDGPAAHRCCMLMALHRTLHLSCTPLGLHCSCEPWRGSGFLHYVPELVEFMVQGQDYKQQRFMCV